jgi:hypothetical protein
MSFLSYWWHKSRFYEGGTNVVFLAKGGTNAVFLAIGGTNVDLIEGGTKVVVAVALLSSGTFVSGKKVAASLDLL